MCKLCGVINSVDDGEVGGAFVTSSRMKMGVVFTDISLIFSVEGMEVGVVVVAVTV
jgi:hypothetical protein